MLIFSYRFFYISVVNHWLPRLIKAHKLAFCSYNFSCKNISVFRVSSVLISSRSVFISCLHSLWYTCRCWLFIGCCWLWWKVKVQDYSTAAGRSLTLPLYSVPQGVMNSLLLSVVSILNCVEIEIFW